VIGCGSSTCSEGIGYGMLIAVNANHKDLFDGLWALVDSLIPVPAAGGTVAGNNLLPWSINSDCTASDYNNATDGDLDIAMSLVQADQRWPGNGYLDNAIPIIKDILNKNTALSNGKRVLLTGAKQPATDGGRPSYFAPAYYRVFIDIFGRAVYADPAQVTGWTELLNSTYSLLSAAQTGMGESKLWPDWWPLDGSTAGGQAFGWDACRAPWRIATDYAWFGSTDASTALLAARAVEPNPYKASPIDPKNSAQVGALAFTAMPAGQAAFQTACDQWMAGPLTDNAYFQTSLKLVYMQLAGGFFPSTL
jgi:endo-1,4-beta-D-glucanase Y